MYSVKPHNVRVNRDAGERYVVSGADDIMRGTSIIRGTMLAQRKTRLRFNALLCRVCFPTDRKPVERHIQATIVAGQQVYHLRRCLRRLATIIGHDF